MTPEEAERLLSQHITEEYVGASPALASVLAALTPRQVPLLLTGSLVMRHTATMIRL